MASSKSYLDLVVDTINLPGLTSRKMMGEYLLYLDGVLFGGIYDDRLLLKPLPAFRALLPDAPLEKPYEGAKPMVLVEDVDNRAFLQSLLQAVYEDLPAPKTGRRTP